MDPRDCSNLSCGLPWDCGRLPDGDRSLVSQPSQATSETPGLAVRTCVDNHFGSCGVVGDRFMGCRFVSRRAVSSRRAIRCQRSAALPLEPNLFPIEAARPCAFRGGAPLGITRRSCDRAIFDITARQRARVAIFAVGDVCHVAQLANCSPQSANRSAELASVLIGVSGKA